MTKNIHDNYNLSNHWLNTLQENSPLRAIIDEYPDKQDRDVVYLSALTLFSSCMPNYTGWWNGNEFTTHMFSFFVGKSATSKSKATVLQGILDDIDDDLRASSQKKINEYNSFTDEQKAQENRPFCEKINFNPDLTSASLFKDLRANEDHGGIIVSSEASHLGASMQGEHGKKLSSYIRNCFSHEVVGKSLSQDDFDVRIKSPKLAILLAGTPGQLQDFIGGKNAENGLIGRFLFRRTFRPKNLKFKASLKIGSGLCDDLKSYANSFYNDFKNAKISFRMHPEDLSY